LKGQLHSTGEDDFIPRLHVQGESLGNLHDRSGFPPGSRSFPARFPSTDQGLAVLIPPASARLVLCRLHVQGHDGLASLCSCASRRSKGKRQGKQAGQPPAACSKQDLRQEETVRALKGVAGQHSAPGSRPTLGMTIMLLAELGIET